MNGVQEQKLDSYDNAKLLLEELQSAGLKHKLLVQRLKNKKKSIGDLWAVFGPRTQYYFLNIVMNCLMFGVFHTLTDHSMVFYQASDFIYTDTDGKTNAGQYTSGVTKTGEFKMHNGKVPTKDFKILVFLSGISACMLLIFTTRYSSTTLSHILGVSVIGSILLGHAFSLHVFERLSFFLQHLFVYAMAILMAIRAFESGPKKYRIFAVAFSTYSGMICFLAKLAFFQQGYGKENADKMTIFVLAVLISFHAMLTPPQFVRAVVRNDFATVRNILERFGCETRLRVTNIESLVHDIYYSGHVPTDIFDGLGHLYKIKPFRWKFAVLTFLLFLEGHVTSHEYNFIRLLLPMNPFESLLTSKFISTYAVILVIALLFFIGRRKVLLACYFVVCVVFVLTGSIPMDAVSMCSNDVRPSDENMIHAVGLFFIYNIAQNGIRIILYLLLLEHTPSLYRTFAIPAAITSKLCLQIMIHLLPVGWKGDDDPHNFSNICLFCSFIALLLTLYCIDNSSFSAFSTAEIPAYQLPIRKITKKKHTQTMLMKTREGW